MEISQVRQRLNDTIERARRAAADRRARNDSAARAYDVFLTDRAVPLFRQVANALKAAGYQFTVFTPSGNVRLASDRNADDFIEIGLDTSGDEPAIVGHVSRARGRRVQESERAIGARLVEDTTEEQLLEFLMRELTPFVER
ncbi:MAG: hypothetical protein LBQ09_01095 [Acidobacteriaceae bacterium]|jgi:hypothetical protein|nr:hypothetical protein [Acidobacteriaceae bacterium]